MRNTAVIRLLSGRLAWYPPGAGEAPRWLDDEAASETLRSAVSQRRMKACFAVPGADVRLLRHTVAPEEKKHLAGSLPFMLEEQVAADVEDLHFASAPLDGEDYAVAIADRRAMEGWREQLADYPGVLSWVPEPLLLPWRDGDWTLVLEDGQALVRTGRCEGFSVELALLPAMLAGSLAGGEPEAVIVYGSDQAQDTQQLPEALRDKVQWRAGDFGSALMLFDEDGFAVNLLQGDYTPKLPLGRWYRQWRAVAALFLAAFVLQLAASYADYRNLNAQNLALRAAVEQSYRKAFPRGAVVDHEKQLRRQLDAIRGTSQGSGFVVLMERVGGAVAEMPGTRIGSINYSDKSETLRLNITAKDFEGVEALRSRLAEAGLQATMENSKAQDDGVRARLRVERS